jgi:hypothetical protein
MRRASLMLRGDDPALPSLPFTNPPPRALRHLAAAGAHVTSPR